MDPEETLRNAADAVASGEWGECNEALGHYREWRAKGGFEPLLGDARAAEIAKRNAALVTFDFTPYRTSDGGLTSHCHGYVVLYVRKDHEGLCAKCAHECEHLITSVSPFWEGAPYDCDECEEPIESSYGDPNAKSEAIADD